MTALAHPSHPGVWAVVLLGLLWTGCASAPPTDAEIWHQSTLRPGVVPPGTHGERELLVRMPDVPVGQPVAFGSQVFTVDAPYVAASGRTCRPVTARSNEADGHVDFRLACEEPDGWAFVPDPFADASVQTTAGSRAPTAGRAP
jgi:hypothetical protein